MYEWSLVAECHAVLEICDSNRVSGNKRIIIIITRQLQSLVTVRDTDRNSIETRQKDSDWPLGIF